MKKITLLAVGIFFFITQNTTAQINMNDATGTIKKTGINNFVPIRYYYYPNLQTYYDTKNGLYISLQNGNWITSEKLDLTTRGYCIKNGAHENIKDYDGDEPYTLLCEHKLQYPADYSSRPKRKLVATID